MRVLTLILFGLLMACEPLDEEGDGGIHVPVEPERVVAVAGVVDLQPRGAISDLGVTDDGGQGASDTRREGHGFR